ncbi:relaxase domain-containing protein (plasmid) [Pantoea vagans]|uniref:relaxase domain-containing protein n=1 Tax=Pantoea vagans TaxID=470934 RepID=UPI00351544E5
MDTFTDILHGNLPNGVVLGKEVQGTHVHRPGHDFTFSAPKSVSMLILAGGDKRLLEAHHDAVKETLTVFNRHGETQRILSARDSNNRSDILLRNSMLQCIQAHALQRMSRNAYDSASEIFKHRIKVIKSRDFKRDAVPGPGRRSDGETQCLHGTVCNQNIFS